MLYFQKTIFLLTGGAFYEKYFEIDKRLRGFFFYSLLNLIPLTVAFIYFGFLKAGAVVLTVLIALFVVMFWLTRRIHPTE